MMHSKHMMKDMSPRAKVMPMGQKQHCPEMQTPKGRNVMGKDSVKRMMGSMDEVSKR